MNLTIIPTYDKHRPLRGPNHGVGYPPTEVEGLRRKKVSVNDPDGTAVELVEFPGGARSSYEMHRGTDISAER